MPLNYNAQNGLPNQSPSPECPEQKQQQSLQPRTPEGRGDHFRPGNHVRFRRGTMPRPRPQPPGGRCLPRSLPRALPPTPRCQVRAGLGYGRSAGTEAHGNVSHSLFLCFGEVLQPLIYLLSRHLEGPGPYAEGESPAKEAWERRGGSRDGAAARLLQGPVGLKLNEAKQAWERVETQRRHTPRRRRMPGFA